MNCQANHGSTVMICVNTLFSNNTLLKGWVSCYATDHLPLLPSASDNAALTLYANVHNVHILNSKEQNGLFKS